MRPRPFNFNGSSDYKIGNVRSCTLVGLKPDDNIITSDIENPNIELWFVFEVRFVPYLAKMSNKYARDGCIVTNGDEWYYFKLADIHTTAVTTTASFLGKYKFELVGPDELDEIFMGDNLPRPHPINLPTIKSMIDDYMARNKVKFAFDTK